MEDKLTITDALKKIKLNEKIVTQNNVLLVRMTAEFDDGRFSTVDDQKRAIKSLVQENTDRLKYNSRLKAQIAYTNMNTRVNLNTDLFGQSNMTITEMLYYKDKGKGCDLMIATFNCLNNYSPPNKYAMLNNNTVEPKRHVFFDEKERLDKLRKWQEIQSNLDGRLETINATTYLLDLPE